MNERETEGWKEAAIAWSVCASIHETWAKGKDALYKTRHADFVRHADDARARALATPPSAPTAVEPTAEQSSVVEPDEHRQYYYQVRGCQAAHATYADCICWHDEGTGPMADEPESIKHWRASKGTPL